MATHPYLHFQGTCAEALAFYADALGGTDLAVMHYGEEPDAPDHLKGSPLVMHGQVRIGEGLLMASDFPPWAEGEAQKGVSVMQTFPGAEALRAAFDRLSGGGEVIQAPRPTFFAPAFAMLRDRFGTHWILSAEPEAGALDMDMDEAEPEAHPT
jgi:PhnB protein